MSATPIPFLDSGIRAVSSLREALDNKSNIDYLFGQLGWDTDISATQVAAVQDAFGLTALLENARTHIEDLAYERGDLVATAESAVALIKEIYRKIEGFRTVTANASFAPLNQSAFWLSLAEDL
jgi:hypothetical protein